MSFVVFFDDSMAMIGEIIGNERFSLATNNSSVFMDYGRCCEI